MDALQRLVEGDALSESVHLLIKWLNELLCERNDTEYNPEKAKLQPAEHITLAEHIVRIARVTRLLDVPEWVGPPRSERQCQPPRPEHPYCQCQLVDSEQFQKGVADTDRSTKFCVHVEPSKLEALRALSKATHVPQAEYVRRGVAMVLEAHGGHDDDSP